MTSEEKILEMLSRINGRLDSMDGRLDSLEAELKEVHGELTDLKEAHEETRTSVNTILDWTETVSAVVPMVPPI